MQDPDYYGLLLQAALFGYTVIRTDPDRNSDGLAPAEGTIIVILVFLITVSGFRYLTTSQISLVKFRRRAARIRTYLGEAFRKCYGEENPIGTSPNKDLVLVLTMMGSLIVGAAIVTGRGGTTIKALAVDDGSNRRVARQSLGIVHVLVSG